MPPAVELIYDPDCPNVADARRTLLRAFNAAGMAPAWTEWDSKASASPNHVRGLGSPTILVDGRDVADGPLEEMANCCRIYPDDAAGGYRKSPRVAQIVAALCRNVSSARRVHTDRTLGLLDG